LKTGRLIGAAVECVLLLSGATEAALADFRAFAAELGVLFQIVDDTLNVTGIEAELGQRTGTDARQGKLTYVSRYGVPGARVLAAEAHSQARAALARAVPGGNVELQQIADFVFARSS
jgi:geranylgeranyl diphosphate synthase type II